MIWGSCSTMSLNNGHILIANSINSRSQGLLDYKPYALWEITLRYCVFRALSMCGILYPSSESLFTNIITVQTNPLIVVSSFISWIFVFTHRNLSKPETCVLLKWPSLSSIATHNFVLYFSMSPAGHTHKKVL